MVNVLVVDDETDIEPLFLQNFKKEINKGECRFHFAFSGEEALTRLTELHPRDMVLVLSDINMPRMSGLELLKTVKYNYPHLTMMLFTAYANKKYMEAAQDMKADGFFPKPIDFPELKKAIYTISTTN